MLFGLRKTFCKNIFRGGGGLSGNPKGIFYQNPRNLFFIRIFNRIFFLSFNVKQNSNLVILER